jgi:hypothetical protein
MTANDINVIKKWPDGTLMKVTIQGGHGVSDKHMFTPKGVVTKVSDRDLELLLENKSFQRHMDRGFITYDKKNVSAEKKAKDMAEKDGSSPLTPKDFVESENSTFDNKVYKKKESVYG